MLHLVTPAQQKKNKIFRPVYFNMGYTIPVGDFGAAPVLSKNVQENIRAGFSGTKPGYLFEFGTKIYFNNSSHKLRYGLDWAFISLMYNELDWQLYAATKKGQVTNAMTASVSSRLGPVISYNITKKLVTDFHFQVAPVVEHSWFDYYSQAGGEEFYYDNKKPIKNFGIKTSAGIGIRWGVIGMAADYFHGSAFASYYYTNTATGEGISNNTQSIKEKIHSSSVQLKISLNL